MATYNNLGSLTVTGVIPPNIGIGKTTTTVAVSGYTFKSGDRITYGGVTKTVINVGGSGGNVSGAWSPQVEIGDTVIVEQLVGLLVSGSNYTINSLIGDKNTNYTLSGVNATTGAKGFIEYSSNLYFQQESGGIFIANPALDPAPTVNVSTVTFAGYATGSQIITQSISPATLYVNVTASAGTGDFLEYSGETKLITNTNFGAGGDLLFSTYQLSLNEAFIANPITKRIGTDIVVTLGGAPVSGTNYKIIDNGILYQINPNLWPANGAYVQYSGQLYYIYRNGFLLASDVAFDPVPVIGTSTVAYVREPVASEIFQFSNGNGELRVANTVTALDPTYNYGGYKLNYNGESRYIISTQAITGDINYFGIEINSGFTTSPVTKLLGTEVTLGDAPVNGQVVYSVGQLQVITGSAVGVGDQLSYSGETITVTGVTEVDQFVYLDIDTSFSNDVVGKVLGVDITITAAPPSPTGKRLIPPPGERTVPENDLTPDVRDVPRNDLVPDIIDKDKLIPS